MSKAQKGPAELTYSWHKSFTQAAYAGLERPLDCACKQIVAFLASGLHILNSSELRDIMIEKPSLNRSNSLAAI